jgi:hypothetical protein
MQTDNKTLTYVTIEYEDGSIVEGVGCAGLLIHNAAMIDFLVANNAPEVREDSTNVAVDRRVRDQ